MLVAQDHKYNQHQRDTLTMVDFGEKFRLFKVSSSKFSTVVHKRTDWLTERIQEPQEAGNRGEVGLYGREASDSFDIGPPSHFSPTTWLDGS